jgi:glutamyl-tRNA synthetase
LGHARTFLIAWLAARRDGGKIVLRVEDLDAARVRAEASTNCLIDLRWLGLDWDEGPDVGGPAAPYVQSERTALYNIVLDALKASESVYPCTCSRSDIARAASAPHAEDEGPSYPGTCAHRCVADAAALGDRPFAWRFRVACGAVAWDDSFLGRRELDPSLAGGDFIVARNTVGPSYQLAVVADDHAMDVTTVIRGSDLVPSTPRQILLFRRLGWPVPRYAHVPLAVTSEGRRLAKRDGSIKLATLRAAGVDPRALVGGLIHSCGLSASILPSAPRDWIERFDLAAMPPRPWVVGAEWLDWLYSRRSSVTPVALEPSATGASTRAPSPRRSGMSTPTAQERSHRE